MSRDQKRIGIILGAVIVAVLLILYFRRQSPALVGAGGNVNFGGVEMPAFNFTSGAPFTIAFPGNPDTFQMIGACCADCSSRSPINSYVPARGPTYVFNEGNRGPNIYYYAPPAPVVPKRTASMTWSGR